MIIRKIERFLRETGMAPTRFGMNASGDPRLVTDLRNGRIPRTRLEARLAAFMDDYRKEHDAH